MELIFKLMTSKKWLRFVGDRGIRTMEDARRYFEEKMGKKEGELDLPKHVIIDAISGAKVGTSSLHDRDGVDGLDIGCAILEEFERMGYATAGTETMIQRAFDEFDVEKVSAITLEENKGSCRVLEKLGFKSDEYIQLPNETIPLKLYVLRREDWK